MAAQSLLESEGCAVDIVCAFIFSFSSLLFTLSMKDTLTFA